MKMVPLPPSCVGGGFMLDVNIRREVVRLLLSSWVGAVMAKLTSLCSLCGHLCTQEFFLVLLVQPAGAIAVLHVRLWVVIGKGLGSGVALGLKGSICCATTLGPSRGEECGLLWGWS